MPAHNDSETGTRFGIGALRGRRRRAAAPRSEPITPSSSSSTVSCRSGTAFGRPVVPDVNWMIASPPRARRRRRRAPATDVHRVAVRSRAATPVEAINRARSASGTRGFSGTNAPPTLHTANHAAIAPGAFGAEHADRPARRDRALRNCAAMRVRPARAARRASSRSRRGTTTTSSGSPSSSAASDAGHGPISASGRRSSTAGWRPMRIGLSGASTISVRCTSVPSATEPVPPLRERAAVPRPFERRPRRQVGDRPDHDRLGVVAPSRHGTRRRTAGRAPRPRAARSRRARRGTPDAPPTGQRHELVRVHRALHARLRQLVDRRAPRLGHDDAVEAAAPQLARPTAHHSASDGSCAPAPDELVLEVRGETLPAVELPHVHDLRPRAGRTDGAPTRRSSSCCVRARRSGTSSRSCGACTRARLCPMMSMNSWMYSLRFTGSSSSVTGRRRTRRFRGSYGGTGSRSRRRAATRAPARRARPRRERIAGA